MQTSRNAHEPPPHTHSAIPKRTSIIDCVVHSSPLEHVDEWRGGPKRETKQPLVPLEIGGVPRKEINPQLLTAVRTYKMRQRKKKAKENDRAAKQV